MALRRQLSAAMPLLVLAFASTANAAAAMTNKGCFSSSQPLTEAESFQFQSSGHCQTVCTGKNQAVLGLTNGSDCYCGNELPATNTQVDNSYCNTPCDGYGQESCGGTGYYTVWLTGLNNNVDNYGATADSTTSSGSTSSSGVSSSTSSSSTQSVVTSVSPGNTVVVTVSASATSTSTAGSSSGSSNTAGIAAGVVVGVLGAAALIGGVFLFLRYRRRRQAEADYQRSAQVSDFMRGANDRRPPNTAYSQMSDSRLDPEAGRRNSVGSMADEQDYSRRILRVANPDH